MTTNRLTVPILFYSLAILAAIINLWFPIILSAALVVVGGFLLYAVYRMNEE